MRSALQVLASVTMLASCTTPVQPPSRVDINGPSFTAVCRPGPDVNDQAYPRGALARGLDSGTAVVRVRVSNGMIDVLEARGTDPAFAAAASSMVKRFICDPDAAGDFLLPMTFKIE